MHFHIDDLEFHFDFINFFSFCKSAIQLEVKKNKESVHLFACVVLGGHTEDDSQILNVNYKEISERTTRKDREILISRFIDRCLRPLIKQFTRKEISINISSLNTASWADMQLITTVAALIVMQSLFPLSVGVSRICKIASNIIHAPSNAQLEESEINLIVCGNKNYLIAVENESIPVDNIGVYINEALEQCEILVEVLSKIHATSVEFDLRKEPVVVKQLTDKYTDEINYEQFRRNINAGLIRLDRSNDEIRELGCKSISPNSVLFSRGKTAVVALVEVLMGQDKEFFNKRNLTCSYVFNSFSTGELTGRKSGSRREIGHAELIRKSLQSLLYEKVHIKVICEILGADGSTSMAGVSAASGALYKMGLIKDVVGGLSFGLAQKKNILCDINAKEDELGDMDFKICGTQSGITALQMDCKQPISVKILDKLFKIAKKKLSIIISTIKTSLAMQPEKTSVFEVEKDRLGLVIGTSGATIRQIIQVTSTKIKVKQDGTLILQGKNLAECIPFLRFYGIKSLSEKERIAFFAKEDFNGKQIPTAIGTVFCTRNLVGKKGDAIFAEVKNWNDKYVAKAQIQSNL